MTVIMSVSGQVQSIFTIEELPVGVEFQVIESNR